MPFNAMTLNRLFIFINPFPLFSKLEPAKVIEWKTLFGGPTQITATVASAQLANGLSQSNKPAATKGESPVKVKKQQSKKVKMVTENDNGQDKSKMEAEKLYAEVMAKYQKAKEIFVANQMAQLDVENAKLREQIEQYKTKLGYTGPLFNPPRQASAVQVQASPSISATPTVEEPKPNGQVEAKKTGGGKKAGEMESANPKQQPGGGGGKSASAADGADQIDVGRLDLRVGRIIEAKKHPDADALYVEQIDLGEEKPRTVVSGLVRFVPLEKMQNRLVVCLCNLKPAKMRGIESQAMVMCASSPEKVEILELDPSCQPGDSVICDPFPHRPDQPFMNPKKKIWEGVAPDLSVSDDGECIYKGHLLRVQRTNCTLKAATLRNVQVK